MDLELLGEARIVYNPLSKDAEETLPRIKVVDRRPRAVYVNSFILDGSYIGEDSFLVGCLIGDGVQTGFRCQMHKCRVGNNVSIGNYSHIGDGTSFGNNTSLGFAVVGPYCRFGDGASMMSSRFSDVSFGDNTRIGHWNRFYGPAEFGRNTSMGIANVFYGHPQFSEKPAMQGTEIQDKSLQIFQTTELDKRDNNGRTVRLMEEYLENELLWLKK